MSIALLGCLLGATAAGALADKYGRKMLLIASAWYSFCLPGLPGLVLR